MEEDLHLIEIDISNQVIQLCGKYKLSDKEIENNIERFVNGRII